MTPLERAARALCDLDGNPPSAQKGGKLLWMDYVPEVRVVLSSLKYPSSLMAAMGGIAGNWSHGCGDDPSEHAKDVWKAMIEVAMQADEDFEIPSPPDSVK